MSQPVIKGTNTAAATSVAIPAHVIGDLIVISASRDGSTTVPTKPAASGTVPAWADAPNLAVAGANLISMRSAYFIATATNHTTGAWTNATGIQATVIQVGTFNPLMALGACAQATGSAANSATAAAVTSLSPDGNGALLEVYAHQNVTAWSAAPAGYTRLASTATEIAVNQKTDSTSDGSIAQPNTAASGGYIGHQIEIPGVSSFVPSTTLLDDFNRTTGLGAAYSQLFGTDPLLGLAVANQVKAGSGVFSGAYRNDQSFPRSSGFQMALTCRVVPPSGHDINFDCCVVGSEASPNGYGIDYGGNGAGSLGKWTAASYTALVNFTLTTPIAAADKFLIDIRNGGVINLYLIHGGSSYLIATANDNTYTGSFRAGWEQFSNTQAWDDLEVGQTLQTIAPAGISSQERSGAFTSKEFVTPSGIPTAAKGGAAAAAGVAVSAWVTALTTDAPIFWPRFDEVSGTSFADSSGNAHTGTSSGSPTLGVASVFTGDSSKGITFDRTLSQYILFDALGTLGSNALTSSYEAVLATTDKGAIGHIFGSLNASNGGIEMWVNREGFAGTLAPGRIEFQFTGSGGSGLRADVIPGAANYIDIFDGQPHRITCVVTSSTTMDVRIDTVLQTLTYYQTGLATPSNLGQGMVVGGSRFGGFAPSSFASFTLWELAMYTTRLTSTRDAAHDVAATLIRNAKPYGIPSRQQVGAGPALTQNIVPAGIPSQQIVGGDHIGGFVVVAPGGVKSETRFGVPQINQNVAPAGIKSEQRMGGDHVGPLQHITPAGIGTRERFGSSITPFKVGAVTTNSTAHATSALAPAPDPLTVQTDDLILYTLQLWTGASGAQPVLTLPSGYKQIGTPGINTETSSQRSNYVIARFYDGTGPPTINVNIPATIGIICEIIRGVDRFTPYDDIQGFQENLAGSVGIPGVTFVNDQGLIVAVVDNSWGQNIVPTNGFTEDYDDGSIELYHKAQKAAGASGTSTFTGTAHTSATLAMALKPITMVSLQSTIITPSGIRSGQRVGPITSATSGVSIVPDGIRSGQRFGAVQVGYVVPGVRSQERFGAVTVKRGTVSPWGMPSAFRMGAAKIVSGGSLSLHPGGIFAQQRLGAATVKLTTTGTQAGIRSPTRFGNVTVAPFIPKPLNVTYFQPVKAAIWRIFMVDSKTLEVIGELINATSRQLTIGLNQSGSSSLVLPIDDPMAELAQTWRTALVFQRNNVWRWGGPIITINNNIGDERSGDTTTINAVGWFERLNSRELLEAVQYADKDAGQIIFSLLDAANSYSDTRISAGTIELSQNRTISYDVDQAIGQAIVALSEIEDGVDFWIDPYTRALNIYARKGEDRPLAKFALGIPPHNILQFTENIDGGEMVNDIHPRGKFGSGFADDDVSVFDYGMFQESPSLSDVVDQEILDAFANEEVAIRSNPKAVYTFTPAPWVPSRQNVPAIFDDFDIGDTIYLSAKRGRVNVTNQAVRLFGATISIDDNDVERITSLNVSPTTFTTPPDQGGGGGSGGGGTGGGTGGGGGGGTPGSFTIRLGADNKSVEWDSQGDETQYKMALSTGPRTDVNRFTGYVTIPRTAGTDEIYQIIAGTYSNSAGSHVFNPGDIVYVGVSPVVDGGTNNWTVNEVSLPVPGSVGDTTPPAAPTGLSAVAGSTTVGLSWTGNSEPDLSGYNIFRSTVSGGPYTQLNTSLITGNSFTDPGLTAGTAYFYIIKAQDTSGNLSAASGQATATPIGGGGGGGGPVTGMMVTVDVSGSGGVVSSSSTNPDWQHMADIGCKMFRTITSGSIAGDKSLLDAAQTRGLTVWFVFTDFTASTISAWLDALGTHAAFAGVIEMGNESYLASGSPQVGINGKTYWTKAAPAIRANHNRCRFLAQAAFKNDPGVDTWMDFIFQQAATEHDDIPSILYGWTVHPYSTTSGGAVDPKSPQSTYASAAYYIGNINQKLANHGAAGMPLWATEWGFATSASNTQYGVGTGTAGEAKQAQWIQDQINYMKGVGNVELAAYYILEPGSSAESSSAFQLGLLRSFTASDRKPAWTTVKNAMAAGPVKTHY